MGVPGDVLVQGAARERASGPRLSTLAGPLPGLTSVGPGSVSVGGGGAGV